MTNNIVTTLGVIRQPDQTAFRRRYEKMFFVTTLLACALPGFTMVRLAAILALWFYLLVCDSFTIASTLWFISVLLNLLIGMQVGAVFQLVPPKDVYSHLLRLLVFFISLGIGSYTATRCSISQKSLDRLIFVIAVGLMSFKLFFVIGIVVGIPLERFQSVFGFDTPTSGIGFGLQRLQFPSDIVAPFLMVCYVGGKKKLEDAMLLFCVAGVVFLSFSRFLFAFYLLCIVLRAFWIKRIDFITVMNLIVCVACVAIFFQTILARFVSIDTKASDQVRADQIHYLKLGIKSFPLLGTGLGSEAHDYLRSEETPYFYEAQWYSTTMQMGFIGMFWYALNIVLAVYVSLRRNYSAFTIIFLTWILSGFTNPYLTALGSAFGLGILLLRCNGEQAEQRSSTVIA